MPKKPDEYTPTVEQLGAIMRARTRNDLGAELGTFTADTRPTEAEAESVIADAVALVAPRLALKGEVPDDLVDLARSICALRAAMLIETSYSPEEDGPNSSSAYDRYKAEYEDALAAYDAAAGEDTGRTRRRAGDLRVGTFLNPTG